MQRNPWKFGTAVVGLLLTCCAVTPVLADGGWSASFVVVDAQGNSLPNAIVEVQQENAKPSPAIQVEKGLWVIKNVPQKVTLNVRDGRSGGTVALMLPNDPAIDASFKVILDNTEVRTILNFESPAQPQKQSISPNTIATRRDLQRSEPAPKAHFVPIVDNVGSSNPVLGQADLCASALPIAIPGSDSGTTVGATVDVGPSCSSAGTPSAPGVWYSVTGNGTSLTASLCGGPSYDSKLTVYGGTCGSLACVAGNDDSCGLLSSVTFCSTSGVPYLILVHGFGSATGAYTLNLTSNNVSCGPPPNDTCSGAIDVGALPASVVGNNTFATNDTLPLCGSSPHNKTIWYSVVGNGMTLTASTCNTGTAVADTELIVYCADCPSLTCVGGDDDSCTTAGGGDFKSIFSWCSESGRTYYIAVGSFSSTLAGNIQLNVTSGGSACSPFPNCGPPICGTDFVVAAPGTFNGNSCDGNDCALGTTQEHQYEITLPNDGLWTFSTCGSSFDTILHVGTTCCSNDVGSNDDDPSGSCGLDSVLTVNLTAGVYYVTIEGFGSACGDYVLDVSKQLPCEVDCPAGGIAENELNCGLPIDTVNGGCNSTPNVFSPISCGQTYCSTYAVDSVLNGGTRDTDWYQVVVGAQTEFTWTVEAEADVLIGMVETSPLGNPDCFTATALDPFAVTGACAPVSVTRCVPPGTYWFFVAFPGFAPDVACGTEYTATLDCIGCAPPSCTGDNCLTATVIPGIPYSTAGDTCSCADDYDEICPFNATGSGDTVYRYTPSVNECVNISLCGNTNYDSKLYVYENACGTYQSGVFHACNDDSCTTPSFPDPYVSELENVNLVGGNTYFIVVDGYFGECGNYTLDITPCGPPCDVVCPGGSTNENELNCGLPDDTVNGGCNSSPPIFSPIACGQTYCSSAAVDAGVARDTDWYQIVVATTTEFTWTVEAEFDVAIGLVETSPLGTPDCATAIALNPFALGGPCEEISVNICLGPGTYWWFVAPSFFDPGLACPSQYTARLDCVGCVIPVGACCRPDGSCDDGITEAGCENWQGDGTLCSGVTCPVPPSNDLCDDAIAVAIPSTTFGDTSLATVDSGFPTCGGAGTPSAGGVWYSVTGNGNTLTASLCNTGTNYDTKISVYCPECDPAVCVTGDDDFCGFPPGYSEVSWCSAMSETYLILVHGFGGSVGAFELSIANGPTCSTPPSCVFVPVCPGTGDCCAPGGTGLPGCKDEECCNLVCGIDPFCCDVFWDDICAGEAADLCAVCAPEPPTGACCQGLGCSQQSAVDCAAAGGTFLGEGSSCSGPGAGNPQVFNADPGLAIPDGDPFGVSHTINVGPSVTIGDVNIDLTIPHTWVGDLIVTVEHLGTTVVIIDQPGVPDLGGFGCDQDNYNLIILDDEAADAIEDQCSPDLTSPPNYSPSEALSAFDGMNSAGAWTITVSDNAGFDEGTLDHWSIHIDEPGPSPCIPRGACCTSPTDCAITTEVDCTGVYLGDGTDCEAIGPTTVYEASPGLAIPDNEPSGVFHNIIVPDSFTIGDVNIDLSVTHTWVGDLSVSVTHGGESVFIIDRPGEPDLGTFGCDQDNYDGIILDDEGADSIEDQCSANLTSPPNYIPNNPLSVFDGMDAAGPWTIVISDSAGFDTGTLDTWSLHIAQPGPNPCEDAFLGACCDNNGAGQGCTEDVEVADCVGPDKVYSLGGGCADITCVCIPLCTGVSVCGSDGCGGTCGVCTDGVACTNDACVGGACVSTPNDGNCDDGTFCNGAETCQAGFGCVSGANPCTGTQVCIEETETCEGGAIPTVSTWGLIVMCLLLLAAGKVYFGFRRFALESNR